MKDLSISCPDEQQCSNNYPCTDCFYAAICKMSDVYWDFHDEREVIIENGSN